VRSMGWKGFAGPSVEPLCIGEIPEQLDQTGRRFLRSTIMSTKPCSRRNSDRWNPAGSSCRMVSWMTGAGKTDERFRLRDQDVAQHGVAGRDATRRRIRSGQRC